MSFLGTARIIVLFILALLLCLGLGLTVAAVATPAWQTVYIGEYQSEHQHGLWIDCTRGRIHIEGSADNLLHCTYKFDDIIDHEHEHHRFYEWQRAVLVLLGAAILLGFVAVCITFYSPCIVPCAILNNVVIALTVLFSLAALGVFFFFSHRVQFRFVLGISRTYEQVRGYSFWMEMTAAGVFLLAFCVSILATTLLFLHRRTEDKPSKTYPAAGTSTAV